MKLLVILFSMLLITNQAVGQAYEPAGFFLRGYDLKKLCEENEVACYYYIAATLDGNRNAHNLFVEAYKQGKASQMAQRTICIPPSFSIKDIHHVVMEYMEIHAKRLGGAAPTYVLAPLMALYPCYR